MKKLLIIFLLYYPIYAYTQGWTLEYSAGYGKYELSDIKDLQNSMLNNYGLKETDCFPGYITHSVTSGLLRGSHLFGSSFSYLTTGGRLQRSDYSGAYTIDMIMNGYRVGAFYRNYLKMRLSSLDLYLQLSSGVLLSNLKMKEQANVYSESLNETTKLKGKGIYFEPSAGAEYHLKNWLHFSLGGGYEADFMGKMKISGRETQFKAHWNGVRLYGGIVFILHAEKKSLNE